MAHIFFKHSPALLRYRQWHNNHQKPNFEDDFEHADILT